GHSSTCPQSLHNAKVEYPLRLSSKTFCSPVYMQSLMSSINFMENIVRFVLFNSFLILIMYISGIIFSLFHLLNLSIIYTIFFVLLNDNYKQYENQGSNYTMKFFPHNNNGYLWKCFIIGSFT